MSLAGLSIFAAYAPNQWHYSSAALHRQSFAPPIPLLLLLIPATWWLLIGRLIQGESLVGDRQFWVTRPYEWKQLLAAKALFVGVWIYVPFVLMLAVIVKEAGFFPLTDAAVWFHCLACVSGCIILPLVVLAAITENFARMTLTLFGGVAALIAGGDLILMPGGRYESMTPYDHHLWIVGVLIAGMVAMVVLHYAIRRVWVARAVVVGIVLLATGLGIAIAAMRDGQISRLYAVSGTAPVQLSLPAEWIAAHNLPTVHVVPSDRPRMVYLEVPVDFSGVAEGAAIETDDVKVTLDDASSGWHWSAPWWTSQTLRILPGTHHGQVEIMLGREQLRRFVMGSATMQLTLAVTELEAGRDTAAVISPGHDSQVVGFGTCSTRAWNRFDAQLTCRSPLGPPPLTRASATWYPKSCSDEERMPNSPLTAAAWDGTPYAGSLESYSHALAYGVFPVRTLRVNLSPDWHDGYDLFRTVGFALCPGTVVHFTQYAVTGRTQVSITIPNSYFQDAEISKFLDDKTEER
jgi:hypothetical protein